MGNNPVALIDPLGLDDCACDWWWDGGGDGGGGDGSGGGGYSGFWGGIGEGPNDPPLPLPCQEADFCMSVWVPADPASSGTGYASPGPDQSYNCGIFCLWQPNIGIPEQGSGGGGGGGAANNGQQQKRTAAQCAGQALKAKGLSIALDFAGSIPFVGNLVSGTAATIKAVDGVVLLGGGVVAAGNALLNSDAAGGAAAGTSIVLGVTNMAIGGTEAIPLLGNAVSFGVGIYDAAGAYSTYQRCMAGTN